MHEFEQDFPGCTWILSSVCLATILGTLQVDFPLEVDIFRTWSEISYATHIPHDFFVLGSIETKTYLLFNEMKYVELRILSKITLTFHLNLEWKWMVDTEVFWKWWKFHNRGISVKTSIKSRGNWEKKWGYCLFCGYDTTFVKQCMWLELYETRLDYIYDHIFNFANSNVFDVSM